MQDYQEYLKFAETLADSARPIALKYFKQQVHTEYKADKTPVTVADKEIEQELRQRISAQYPDHSIMGEEFAMLEKPSDFCWVIDPIDGTKAFVAGVPTFTTLIGLMFQGKPVVGVVDQPVTKERWSAAIHSDLPAPSTSRSVTSLAGRNIATTSEGYFSNVQQCAIQRIREEGATLTFGGDAYAYMQLIEGTLDAVFDVSLKPHDILPMMPVLQKAELWIGFFEHGKHVMRMTDSVVVAKEQSVGEQVLRELTAD